MAILGADSKVRKENRRVERGGTQHWACDCTGNSLHMLQDDLSICNSIINIVRFPVFLNYYFIYAAPPLPPAARSYMSLDVLELNYDRPGWP